MRRTLAIDPGLHGVGWAVAENAMLRGHQGGKLLGAGYYPGVDGRGPETWNALRGLVDVVRDFHCDTLLLEFPEWYYQNSHARAEDLLELAAVDGFMVGAFPYVTMRLYVQPKEWKGQLPKNVHHARLAKKLSPEEHQRIQFPGTKELDHNVWDAVGLAKARVRA